MTEHTQKLRSFSAYSDQLPGALRASEEVTTRRKYTAVARLILLSVLVSASPGSLAASGEASADRAWTTITADELESRKSADATAWIRPDTFNAVSLDPATLDSILAASPTILTVPLPDGGFERFLISESPVMHPDLEQWMAEQGWPMKTYSGKSLDKSATTIRLDWGGPAGLHAMVDSPERVFFIDPYWQGDIRLYASYFKRDYTLGGKGKPFRCEVGDTDAGSAGSYQALWNPDNPPTVSTGGVLRSYDIAVAATGEYTAVFGGTKAEGQAAVVTSINRINLVYERELSVHLNLVADNMDIIFTDSGSDGYTDSDCGAMINENQTIVDAEIGDANYDIGHVFGTGASGGIAQFEAVCDTGGKARGCSAISNPMGDGFDIGILAHEIGHQFGASHTFNGQDSFCGAAWSSLSAYEPGSGSTIMAYQTICGVDNLPPPGGDYFHRRSLDQMGTFINDPAGGGSCDATGGIINANEPTANAGADHTIPIGTPFELTGSGTDADNDTLTFNWEQFDLGTQAPLATGDDGTQPIFRSYPSTSSPTRVFPRLGTAVPGETLPITNRTMNFRMTVRDNRSGGGRENDDLALITSTTTAGPFMVSIPNGGEAFAASSAQTVTWAEAGTAGGSVNTPNVDILLSGDGGLTYPETLVSNTPNDGSEGVIMPTTMSTASARIKIRGAGNVFFDASDADFSVDAQCRAPALALADPGSVFDQMTIAGSGTISDLNLKLDITHSWVGDLTVVLEHVDTGTSATLIDQIFVSASVPQGCHQDDISADLDDEGFAPVNDQCPFPEATPAVTGRLTPENPLSVFDGESFGGTWKLTVSDAFGGDSGTLDKWCLDGYFGTPPGGCPASLTLDNDTLSGIQLYQATVSVTLGPSLVVNGSDIVVKAPTVIFGNGVTIDGTFQAGNDPNCT